MEIVIRTADPESIDTEEIQRAVEALGYFVLSVSIEGVGDEEEPPVCPFCDGEELVSDDPKYCPICDRTEAQIEKEWKQ